MTHIVQCKRLNKEAPGLDHIPYPGKMGQKIYDNISKEAWDQWLAHQTMLINEYRLNLLEPKSRTFLETEMEKYLFSGESEKPAGYVAPDNNN